MKTLLVADMNCEEQRRRGQLTVSGNLEDVWRFAARDLGLDVEVPFELNLPSGERLSAAVLLRKFGSAKGTALVRKYESVSSLRV